MKRFKVFMQSIKQRLVSLFYYLKYRKLPICKKILAISYAGKQYSDSPRVVCEKVLEMFPGYAIVFCLIDGANKFFLPDGIKIINPKNKNIFYRELFSSSVFLTNEDISCSIRKKKGQLFIQFWHADRAIKKVLYDGFKKPFEIPPVLDDKYTDICVAGSDIGESVYRTAFKFKGKILKIGMPRNDCLVSSESRIKKDIFLSYYGIDPNKNILLYAPTFRDNISKAQISTIDINATLSELKRKTHKEWICLVRAHSASLGIQVTFENNIIDVTDYPDMSDILCSSDMLITDYSSCSGDFVITKKPIIIAAFDIDEYIEKCRDFRVPLMETGYLVARNQEELNKLIATLESNDYTQSCEKVIKYFGITEYGNSADAICKIIINNGSEIL